MEQYQVISTKDLKRIQSQLDRIEAYLSKNKSSKGEWINAKEAMETIGCKVTKLRDLRLSGVFNWRFAGKRKCVMYFKADVEKFILQNSTFRL